MTFQDPKEEEEEDTTNSLIWLLWLMDNMTPHAAMWAVKEHQQAFYGISG
jgi:hypothetical protein